MLESRDYNINQYLRTEINSNNLLFHRQSWKYLLLFKEEKCELIFKNASLNYIRTSVISYHSREIL